MKEEYEMILVDGGKYSFAGNHNAILSPNNFSTPALHCSNVSPYSNLRIQTQATNINLNQIQMDIF